MIGIAMIRLLNYCISGCCTCRINSLTTFVRKVACALAFFQVSHDAVLPARAIGKRSAIPAVAPRAQSGQPQTLSISVAILIALSLAYSM